MSVVSAMKAHPDTEAVCEQACSALRNLAFDSLENRTAIIAAGGDVAVLTAMARLSLPLVLTTKCRALPSHR